MSVNLSVCPSVPSVTSCLDQSIFIILAQINKQTCLDQSQSIFTFLGRRALREQSESNQELKEHSERTQRALREHSESTQRTLKSQKH